MKFAHFQTSISSCHRTSCRWHHWLCFGNSIWRFSSSIVPSPDHL